MRFRILVIFALTLILVGCFSKPQNEILARFGGEVITQADFDRKVSGLPRSLRPLAMRRKKEFIEDMAAERFLEREAERRGFERDQDVKELLSAARKKILTAKLIDVEVDKKISLTPEEVQQYHQAHQEEFMTSLMLRASHILVRTEKEAGEIRVALASGADFEELARARSLDATAIRGGDLGFFQKGQFVPEFEQVAFGMKKGQTSDPVKSQFGWHIIKLTDRVEPSLREFHQVKSRVEERIVNEKRSKLFKTFLEKLKGNVKIEFNEKALESLK